MNSLDHAFDASFRLWNSREMVDWKYAISFFNLCRTRVDMSALCRAFNHHALYELICIGHCQYSGQNSREAKCLLGLEKLNFPSIVGIGHCLATVAAFTGRRSIVVRDMTFETWGAKWGAAFQTVWEHVSMKFNLNNLDRYTLKRFCCSADSFSSSLSRVACFDPSVFSCVRLSPVPRIPA